MEAVEKSGWSWAAVPRGVWLGAAACGIAVASAGAAMWLAPSSKPAAAANEPIVAPLATVTPAKPAEAARPAARAEAAKPPVRAEVAKPPVVRAEAAKPDVCGHCGVVESVQAVVHKGEGTGIGAVAGGVLGGVVGNQMGKGNGNKAMTVLGAVGGGLAGHEIEKRARAETTYTVKVRMDDGTLRTFTEAQAPAIGARVTVNGSTLRMAQGTGQGAGS